MKRSFQTIFFIRQVAKLLKGGNKAIALWENNNSVMEESLLLILSHRQYTFVIWENINENRACYIFKYKNDSINEKIKKLKRFINSDIEYKRWDLFNNKGNKKRLRYDEYFTVIHEGLGTYTRSINSCLAPYFKIK